MREHGDFPRDLQGAQIVRIALTIRPYCHQIYLTQTREALDLHQDPRRKQFVRCIVQVRGAVPICIRIRKLYQLVTTTWSLRYYADLLVNMICRLPVPEVIRRT